MASFAPIPSTNTAVPHSTNLEVALFNWFVEVECTDSACGAFEIWWGREAPNVNVEFVVVPDGHTPLGPVIPSIIVTVNQVGS